MTFLAPLFLAGALAAALPIVLHLLKREPEARVKFAAVQMLQHAPVEHAARRRLRQLILLALRIAALLLLALAFARPFLSSDAVASATGVTVVALDTSFSLSAPGRFARAQQLAKEAIARAPAGHAVGVVTFADGAQLTAQPSGDRSLSSAAVDAARVGFGGTRYRAALSTAADAVGGREGAIIVVTDLQASGWDTGDRVAVPEGVAVQVVDVGPPPANVAIVGARLAGERIVATVRNASPETRDVRLHLSVDGQAAGEAASTLGPEQTADVMLPAAKGAAAQINVDDPEGIAADNVRYLLLSASSRPSVLLVTNSGDLGRDAFYTQQALTAAGADGATYDVTGASGTQVSGWDATALQGHAAVVLASTRGLDQRGRELLAAYVKRGGGVLLAAGPDVDAEVASGALGGSIELTALPPASASAGPVTRTLAPVDVRHPVFRAFAAEAATLGLVSFRQIAAIRGAGCQPLARFSTGEPALIECPLEEGRALAFASDLDTRWNDFPVHATFVPFLHEAVAYLAGSQSVGASYVVGRTPADAPAEPGIGSMPGVSGGTGRRVVVNVDPRESDPSRISSDEFQAVIAQVQGREAAPPRLEARQQEERQSLWRYAILLMIGALVAESLLAARTA
jgi:Aerotolerance regulator N-terminal/von Willebrand factor type A domain